MQLNNYETNNLRTLAEIACLRSKMDANSEGTSNCVSCGVLHTSQPEVVQTEPPPYPKLPLPCRRCGKVHDPVTAEDLVLYPNIRTVNCQVCGMCFTRYWLLQAHLRHHMEETPYQCYVCMRFFDVKQSLRVHLFTHSEKGPFTCHRCRKSYEIRSELFFHHEHECQFRFISRHMQDSSFTPNVQERFGYSNQIPIYKRPSTSTYIPNDNKRPRI